MKHLKKLQMIVALLMAINIVSVGYSAWSITASTSGEYTGGFTSYPVKNSNDYFIFNGVDVSFTEFFNYDPDPTNTNEDGTPDISDNVGRFMMVEPNKEGYLNISDRALITFKFLRGGLSDKLLSEDQTKVMVSLEITVTSSDPENFKLFLAPLNIENPYPSSVFTNTNKAEYSATASLNDQGDTIHISATFPFVSTVPENSVMSLSLPLQVEENTYFSDSLIKADQKIDFIVKAMVKV